jgi:hypothetical protein
MQFWSVGYLICAFRNSEVVVNLNYFSANFYLYVLNIRTTLSLFSDFSLEGEKSEREFSAFELQKILELANEMSNSLQNVVRRR